jgi:hypothetical protein
MCKPTSPPPLFFLEEDAAKRGTKDELRLLSPSPRDFLGADVTDFFATLLALRIFSKDSMIKKGGTVSELHKIAENTNYKAKISRFVLDESRANR